MSINFTKATRKGKYGRVSLHGPSGSGKTMTALKMARAMVGPEGRIAVIDTERGSASKYAGMDGIGDYDVCELESFAVQNYNAALDEAEKAGYDAVIIDSASHAWSGKDGILEAKDNAAKRSRSGSTFDAWREVTPLFNEWVDRMLRAKMHILVTMRVKMEYVQEKDERTGKNTVRKVGLQPIQRDGLEYEFDVILDLDIEHNAIVSKTRCDALDGKVFRKPGAEIGNIYREWLNGAAPESPAPKFDSASSAIPPSAMPEPTEPTRKELMEEITTYMKTLELGKPEMAFVVEDMTNGAKSSARDMSSDELQDLVSLMLGWTKDRAILDAILESRNQPEGVTA